MYEEYDKTLHGPLKYKTMESPAQELDEAKLDAAIADMLKQEPSVDNKVEPIRRPEFPDLKSQEDVTALDAHKDAGLSAVLRQKWAEFSGAA